MIPYTRYSKQAQVRESKNNGYRVSVWDDEKVPGMDSSDGNNTAHLEMGKIVNLVMNTSNFSKDI